MIRSDIKFEVARSILIDVHFDYPGLPNNGFLSKTAWIVKFIIYVHQDLEGAQIVYLGLQVRDALLGDTITCVAHISVLIITRQQVEFNHLSILHLVAVY